MIDLKWFFGLMKKHPTLRRMLLNVESEGFEPSSKRREIQLSTCLFFDSFST